MDYDLDLQTTQIDVELGENLIELELPGGARGLKGDTGDTGEPGPANTLTIGTVEGGEEAGATITGESPNQTLNLTLPRGEDGTDGVDGFSPTITSSKTGKTTTLTITDVNGTRTATILDGADGEGSGDMNTSVYDTNVNGIVDNAEKVNNHTVNSDVPADAVFTDTTYTNVSEFTNDAGYLTSETDPIYSASAASGITSTDISNWNNKSDFSGSYNDLTNKPIYDASYVADAEESTITNAQFQEFSNAHTNGNIITLYGVVATPGTESSGGIQYITLSYLVGGNLCVKYVVSSEVNNHTVTVKEIELADSDSIPTATSDLTNDSNFAVTNANNNFSVGQTIAGETVVDSIRTKNMFDSSGAMTIFGAYVDTTNNKITANANSACLFVKCKPNTTYTISRISRGKRAVVAESVDYPVLNTPITFLGGGTELSSEDPPAITTSANAEYLIMWYSNTGGNNNNGYTEEEIRKGIQIEEGAVPTPFTSYQNLNPDAKEDVKYVTVTGTNLNDYIEDGIYFFNADYTPTNIPEGVNGWLQVFTIGKDNYSTDKFIKQLWFRAGTPNSNDFETFVRTRSWDGNWGNWRKIITEVDTNWQNITLNNLFTYYGNDANNTPKYKKIGNIVYLAGVITPTQSLDSSIERLIGDLPVGYRPSHEVRIVCQGSQMNRWLLTVFTSGNIMFQRYGTTSYSTVPTGAWLPFNVSFIADYTY